MILCTHDPGPTQSACVWWDTETDRPAVEHGPPTQLENREYLKFYKENLRPEHVVCIEQVINYGHVMDKNARDTIRYSGRIEQIALDRGCKVFYITYSDVAVHLCGMRNAKQSQINAALAGRYGYGSVVEGKGTIKKPGIFHGMKEHIFSAAALAVFTTDLFNGKAFGPPGFVGLSEYAAD